LRCQVTVIRFQTQLFKDDPTELGRRNLRPTSTRRFVRFCAGISMFFQTERVIARAAIDAEILRVHFPEVVMRRTLVAMLLVLPPAAAGAQGASEAARAFLRAHSSSQWAEMARLVDSASQAVVRAEATRTLRTMAALPRYQPPASDTGAATGFRRVVEGAMSMTGSMLEMTFANVRTEQEMNALSNLELMARWFEAKSPEYLLRSGMVRDMMLAFMSADSLSVAKAAMTSAVPALPQWEVVGEFRERDGAAHVIYRVAGKTPRAGTGVLTFRRARDRKWYLTFENTDDQLAPFAAMVPRAMMGAVPGR